MKRKVVQIAATGLKDASDVVYALCDDGSILSLIVDAGEWYEEPPIPQPPQGKARRLA